MVRGSRFKVQCSRFNWFKVQGSRFKVQGSRFKAQGLRFKEVQDGRRIVKGVVFMYICINIYI